MHASTRRCSPPVRACASSMSGSPPSWTASMSAAGNMGFRRTVVRGRDHRACRPGVDAGAGGAGISRNRRRRLAEEIRSRGVVSRPLRQPDRQPRHQHDDSIPLEDFPDNLIKATLATEDRRFYDHFGIDIVGTGRALVTNAQAGGVRRADRRSPSSWPRTCSSTNERTIERKVKEAFLAVWLEWRSPRTRSSSSISTAPIWAAALSASMAPRISTSTSRRATSLSRNPPCSPGCSRRRPNTRRTSTCPPRAPAPTWCWTIWSMPAS